MLNLATVEIMFTTTASILVSSNHKWIILVERVSTPQQEYTDHLHAYLLVLLPSNQSCYKQISGHKKGGGLRGQGKRVG